MVKLEKAVQHLLSKFPESDEDLIRFFLTRPNEYLDGRLPWRLRKVERIDSLFDRFLHPADVF